MSRVRYHRLSLRELFAAAKYCDRERAGAGARLMKAFERTTARIATAPGQGNPYLYGTRRFILPRFPYSTVYVAPDDHGHVIAVAHHSRRPGYWRKRLKDVS